MQIFYTLLLTLPIALAAPATRGCGTIQDKSGIAQTLLGDQECRGIGFKAEVMRVGNGCMCVGFSSDKCGAGNPEKTWKAILANSATVTGMEDYGVQWYSCSADPAWQAVGLLAIGLWNRILI